MTPVFAVRCEHTVKSGQVYSGLWHQRRQSSIIVFAHRHYNDLYNLVPISLSIRQQNIWAVRAGQLVVRLSETKKLVGEEVYGFLPTAGPTMSPFNAWIFLNGLETLPSRMQIHGARVLELTLFLFNHPNVIRVLYPDLP